MEFETHKQKIVLET